METHGPSFPRRSPALHLDLLRIREMSASPYTGAIVTGGGSGIGRALVRALLTRDVPVLAVALHADELASLRRDLASPLLTTLAIDLTAPGAADHVLAAAPPFDLLVNCAGRGLWGDHLDLDRRAVHNLIALNIAALTDLCAVVGAQLRDRGRGTILNVASTASFQPLPGLAAYAASKHYVAAFSAALADELAPHGVRVSTLHPGTTRTAFLASAGIDASPRSDRVGRLAHRVAMDPDAVAAAALTGLLRDQRTIVPGLRNRLHHLVARLLPAALLSRLVARLGRQSRAKSRPRS